MHRNSDWLIVLGFNDMSTLVGHFVSSSREREKRDIRDSRRDEREKQGRKRKRNESEETEEIITFPLYPYLLQEKQALPYCKPISVGRPGDVRYTTPSWKRAKLRVNILTTSWLFINDLSVLQNWWSTMNTSYAPWKAEYCPLIFLLNSWRLFWTKWTDLKIRDKD